MITAQTKPRGADELIRCDEPMARHTTFRIGGPSDYFAQPRNEQELTWLLRHFHERGVRVVTLGMGSNLLVRDEGLRAAVLCLTRFEVSRLEREGNRLTVGAGVKLPKLVRFACEQGLAGLEALVGIPGTVGGAAVMNAGGKYGNIGDFVTSVCALDPSGASRRLGKAEAGFGYRSSRLGSCLVTVVELELPAGEASALQGHAATILAEKKRSQPLSAKCAGCVFKNPPGHSAGALIDQAGLKSLAVGDALVSPKHANFIVNRGAARASDVLELIEMVRERVKARFQIELELEVKVW